MAVAGGDARDYQATAGVEEVPEAE
jgi:hypothetical protein